MKSACVGVLSIIENKFMFSYGFHNGNTVFLLEGQFENADAQNAYLQVSDNTPSQNAVQRYFLWQRSTMHYRLKHGSFHCGFSDIRGLEL